MFPRSFRSRLTWFFVIIVVLPMVAVSVVLFRLVADAERGKSEALLAQAQTTARGLFMRAEDRAARAGRDFARSPDLSAAIASENPDALGDVLSRLAAREGVSRVQLTLPGGRVRQASGTGQAVAPAETTLRDPADGSKAGTLRLSVETARGLADLVESVAGVEAVIAGPDGRILAATLAGVDPMDLPPQEVVGVGGRDYRVSPALNAPAWQPGEEVTVRLLADQRGVQAAITEGWAAVALVLLAILALAFAFALTLSKALQSQVQRLLTAARRLGGGELHVEVPTEGGDEFAAIGTEFNAMARQLESRMQELESERSRLTDAIRRVGDSFATNLDRDALLHVIVQTAMDGVAASTGRASVFEEDGEALSVRARVGDTAGINGVLDAAEAAALERRHPAVVDEGEYHVLSHPLRPSEGNGTALLGLLTVARRSRPFSPPERELFNYLANQAAVSVENVDLHETVQRQAVTDELTGLFNHRRFQEVMAGEVERARRYEQPLGLVMLDLDDFKAVNDRHGHLQGDLVLREVARVLLETAREIDEPARYGGEEMAIALPQTDLAGAHRFAERLRERIEALEVPLVAGEGTLRVTASLGAAALPESAANDKDALVAAADSALYRAKRLGKNRVVLAG